MTVVICGYEVLIDDEDYEKIKRYHWNILRTEEKKGYKYFQANLKRCDGKRRKVMLHRIIMNAKTKEEIIDHKNGDTLDNRKTNLRICNKTENNRNQKTSKANVMGIKGVSFVGKKELYQARITVDKKLIHLGYYKTSREAYSAYCEASKKYHGEYGRLK